MGLKICEVLGIRAKNIGINKGNILLSKKRQLKIPFYFFGEMYSQLKKGRNNTSKTKKKKTALSEKKTAGLTQAYVNSPFLLPEKKTQVKETLFNGRQFIDPSTLHAFIKKAYMKAAIKNE